MSTALSPLQLARKRLRNTLKAKGLNREERDDITRAAFDLARETARAELTAAVRPRKSPSFFSRLFR